MKLLLTFDAHSHLVYIPDGYIENISTLKDSFIAWLDENPSTFLTNDSGVFFDQHTFIQYINCEVLKESKERAYFIGMDCYKKSIPVIHF